MYHELGYHDFPLPRGQKAPPPKGWQKSAGTRLESLGNIGLSTDNFCAVDADTKEAARKIYRLFRPSLTTIVETKKGCHFWFSGQIKNSCDSEQHIDTRGVGGYIVVPPSHVDDWDYRFVEGHPLVPVDQLKPIPEELKPKEQKEMRWNTIEEVNYLRRITRARAWLAAVPPAVDGEYAGTKMFYCCCQMFQKFGLKTVEEVWPLILEYNSKCLPPFAEKRLLHKVSDAFKKSNPQGESNVHNT